jgi:hypothetical protein
LVVVPTVPFKTPTEAKGMGAPFVASVTCPVIRTCEEALCKMNKKEKRSQKHLQVKKGIFLSEILNAVGVPLITM